MTTYRVHVKRYLGGEPSGSDNGRVRTVVFEPESHDEGRLRSNTDYVFQGRLMDDTLFVSRHNVQRHTSELEHHMKTLPLC